MDRKAFLWIKLMKLLLMFNMRREGCMEKSSDVNVSKKLQTITIISRSLYFIHCMYSVDCRLCNFCRQTIVLQTIFCFSIFYTHRFYYCEDWELWGHLVLSMMFLGLFWVNYCPNEIPEDSEFLLKFHHQCPVKDCVRDGEL